MSKESLLVNKGLRNVPMFRQYLTPAVMLGLILLLGTALRLYNLGVESYWNDEMYTVIEGQQSFRQLITAGRLDQPLAYYLPFSIWVQTFGITEVSTRLFSVLAGIGSIFLVYLVGQELFGKTVGLLSAFIMAIAQFQITYSQTARFYSFFELTTLFSFLFFILALKSKKIIYFVLYVAASILMAYSNIFGVFILATQSLFLILQIKKYKNMIIAWIICQASVLLAMIPYFYPLIFWEKGIQGAVALNIGYIPAPSIWHPMYTMYRFILPFYRGAGLKIVLLSFAVAGALLAAGACAFIFRQGKSGLMAAARDWTHGLQEEAPDVRAKLILVGCWLVCPIALPFVISMVITPIYKYYYTISAAPALYLLLALGIFSIRKVAPIMFSLTLLMIMILPGLGQYYITDVNPQWKEAAMYVEKNSGPGEVIVFAPFGEYGEQAGIQQSIFTWYYRGTLQGCSLVGELINPVAISDALIQCISGYDRFWIIIPEDQPEIADYYRSFFLSPNQKTVQLVKAIPSPTIR